MDRNYNFRKSLMIQMLNASLLLSFFTTDLSQGIKLVYLCLSSACNLHAEKLT